MQTAFILKIKKCDISTTVWLILTIA